MSLPVFLHQLLVLYRYVPVPVLVIRVYTVTAYIDTVQLLVLVLLYLYEYWVAVPVYCTHTLISTYEYLYCIANTCEATVQVAYYS